MTRRPGSAHSRPGSVCGPGYPCCQADEIGGADELYHRGGICHPGKQGGNACDRTCDPENESCDDAECCCNARCARMAQACLGHDEKVRSGAEYSQKTHEEDREKQGTLIHMGEDKRSKSILADYLSIE